jgi:sulfonate transport system permease protein
MIATLKNWFNRYLILWIVPIIIVIIWQILVDNGLISTRILPAPLDVARAAARLATSDQLLLDVRVSTQRALIGLAIGGGIGFGLGLLNGLFPISEKLLDTTLQMIRTIPHLALLPLVILWFGIGETARIFLIALGVFFPVYLNTYHGIRSADPGLVEMGRVYGLSTVALFQQVIFPGALPSILVGLRYALGNMWLTLIVAETIAANAGIGYMTTNAREFIQTDVLVFATLLYAFLGKLTEIIARFLERQLLKWHPTYQLASAR